MREKGGNGMKVRKLQRKGRRKKGITDKDTKEFATGGSSYMDCASIFFSLQHFISGMKMFCRSLKQNQNVVTLGWQISDSKNRSPTISITNKNIRSIEIYFCKVFSYSSDTMHLHIMNNHNTVFRNIEKMHFLVSANQKYREFWLDNKSTKVCCTSLFLGVINNRNAIYCTRRSLLSNQVDGSTTEEFRIFGHCVGMLCGVRRDALRKTVTCSPSGSLID
jgi:hypothetical protein